MSWRLYVKTGGRRKLRYGSEIRFIILKPETEGQKKYFNFH